MGFLRNNKEPQSGTYNHSKPQASPIKQRRGKTVLVAAVGRGGHFFLSRKNEGKMREDRREAGLSASPLSGGQKDSFSRPVRWLRAWRRCFPY